MRGARRAWRPCACKRAASAHERMQASSECSRAHASEQRVPTGACKRAASAHGRMQRVHAHERRVKRPDAAEFATPPSLRDREPNRIGEDPSPSLDCQRLRRGPLFDGSECHLAFVVTEQEHRDDTSIENPIESAKGSSSIVPKGSIAPRRPVASTVTPRRTRRSCACTRCMRPWALAARLHAPVGTMRPWALAARLHAPVGTRCSLACEWVPSAASDARRLCGLVAAAAGSRIAASRRRGRSHNGRRARAVIRQNST